MFVTLNPPKEFNINRDKLIKEVELKHPLLEKDHLLLSQNVNKIQGHNMTFYTGAWLGYGFHEDGLKSSINIVNLIFNK